MEQRSSYHQSRQVCKSQMIVVSAMKVRSFVISVTKRISFVIGVTTMIPPS